MATRSLLLLLLFVVFDPILALSVTPNSPCSSKCTDATGFTSSSTTTANIVCDDSEFTSTNVGATWKGCMSCLQNSTYAQGDESDQAWFLYNLRYSFDSCVFGYPNGTGSALNPCETSTACGTFKTALEYNSLSANYINSEKFGYCDASGGSLSGQYYDACLNCVIASGDTNYIANSLVALEAGCSQRPNTTDLLGLSGSVFSTSLVQIVDPSTLNKSSDASSLSTAAIAGIAAGGAALVILVAAIIFVRYRKRKNRANIGMTPRWGKDKRRSSFSFKCRNILASPLSPKFFSDRPPVDEHQPYGSLEEQLAGMSTINRAPDGRYRIESKPKVQLHPYETALDGRRTQDTLSSFQSTLISDQWDEQLHVAKKRGVLNKSSMTIDTSEAGLSPPPAAHQSPKANEFGVSPILTRLAPAINMPYTPTNNTSANTSPVNSFSRGSPKPLMTTMSSQGSGYPSRKSPETSSPLAAQQHGWPSARGTPEPWFPPPPPSGSSPSSYGRKVSLGAVGTSRKGKRESGSPVESKQVRVVFPGPPQR